MTFARRVDSNHAEIKDAFEYCGCSVFDTSRVPKFTDLVVGFMGVNVIVEVKSKDGKLTVDQIDLRDTWRGWREEVRNTDDVIKLVTKIKAKVMRAASLELDAQCITR